jgi:hypothetical protein
MRRGDHRASAPARGRRLFVGTFGQDSPRRLSHHPGHGSSLARVRFNDSAEELRESFYEGVASGRAKANDATVHNRVMLLVAYYQARGDELSAAQNRVLNDLWHHVRESDAGRDFLSWPQPQSMQS